MLHLPKLHVLHPDASRPHVEPRFDEHPWRVLPVALVAIVIFAAVLIVVSFVVAKAVTGHAY